MTFKSGTSTSTCAGDLGAGSVVGITAGEGAGGPMRLTTGAAAIAVSQVSGGGGLWGEIHSFHQSI